MASRFSAHITQCSKIIMLGLKRARIHASSWSPCILYACCGLVGYVIHARLPCERFRVRFLGSQSGDGLLINPPPPGLFLYPPQPGGGGGSDPTPPAISKTDGRRETDEAAFERSRQDASKQLSKI